MPPPRRKFTPQQKQAWKTAKQEAGYAAAEASPFKSMQDRQEELKKIEEFIRRRGATRKE
jgi:hypothetical protein